MRDRLIELLIKSGVTWNPGGVADNLLENGVMVFPCKLGDMLYIVGTKCLSGLCDDECETYDESECPCHLEREYVVFTRKLMPDLLATILNEKNPNFILYKNVFPTKEQAEKALAEVAK